MLTFYKEPSITILLATFAPTIAFIAVNTESFSKQQIRNSLSLVAGCGLLLSGVFYFLSNTYLYLLFDNFIDTPSLAIEIIACVISMSLFFAFSERVFSELFPSRKTSLYCIVILSAVFIAATYFVSIAILNVVLALYISLSSFDYFKNKSEAFSGQPMQGHAKAGTKVKFKHKPNIYVLFLESFHSGDVLKSIYGMDNNELCANLKSKKFTLYDDVFSNYPLTAISFSSMVWPDNLYNIGLFGQSLQLPPSRVFSAFEDNGYQLNIFSTEFLKVRFSSLFHHADSVSSNFGTNMHKMFAPVLAQSAFLRNLMSTIDIFESVIDFESLFNEFKRKISDNVDSPQLHWFHFGASHSPLVPWNETQDFGKEYPDKYRNAEKDLKQTVDMIMESDSDPLIIAVGDHGAYRYRYLEVDSGKNPNTVIRSRGFEPELIAKDICSVFLGIRWPVANYTKGEVLTHARIFDHVLAALCEDRTLLNDMAPNLSFHGVKEYGMVILAEDGMLLKDWKPVQEKEQLSFLLDRVRKNPKDIANHLSLASKYFELRKEDKGLRYLLELCEKFPDSEVVHSFSSKKMVKYDIEKAAELARTAIEISPTSSFAHYCMAMVGERRNVISEYYEHLQKAFQYDGVKVLPQVAHLHYAYALMKAEKYTSLSNVVDMMEDQTQEVVVNAIDWQMGYRAHLEGDNEWILDWTDNKIANAPHDKFKKEALEKKLVICIRQKKWEAVYTTAQGILVIDDTHLGAHIVLWCSLERQGKLGEALQALAIGVQTTQNNVLLEQLGAFADRHKIHEPSLASIKVTARKQMKERAAFWAKLTAFDAKWYAAQYGPLLNGLSPIEHYIQYSIALMLNPNNSFDTAFYYSNNPDVFKNGVDASVHYNQYGQHEVFRPRATCLCEPLSKVDIHWNYTS